MREPNTPVELDMVTLIVHVSPNDAHIESKVAKCAAGKTLHEALRDLGHDIGRLECVLVGDPATDLETDEDDEHNPTSLNATVGSCAHDRHLHVHCHSCRAILVNVHFESKSLTRKFSPARSIAQVRTWALRGFGLKGEAAADKLVLEVCDTNVRPRLTQRLGQIVGGSACEVCFSLQPSVAPQG
jgi:hypothetical protein